MRGKDVFLVQPTSPPGVNDNPTKRSAHLGDATLVGALDHGGVAPTTDTWQDRKMRVPIPAADVARLESAGVDRVVTVDLHCGQIQGFFGPETPCGNLDKSVVALPYFELVALGLEPTSTVILSVASTILADGTTAWRRASDLRSPATRAIYS